MQQCTPHKDNYEIGTSIQTKIIYLQLCKRIVAPRHYDCNAFKETSCHHRLVTCAVGEVPAPYTALSKHTQSMRSPHLKQKNMRTTLTKRSYSQARELLRTSTETEIGTNIVTRTPSKHQVATATQVCHASVPLDNSKRGTVRGFQIAFHSKDEGAHDLKFCHVSKWSPQVGTKKAWVIAG